MLANDDGHDAPSPSASSIFLPLGRRSRRESRASISTQIDKETLMEALDNIHTAASQSQTLTVFNEYTSPPSASTSIESKGLAGELQGGLTGLYNKFRASVGGARDVTPNAGKSVESQILSDDTSTRSSGRSTPSTRPASHGTKPSQIEIVAGLPTSAQTSRLHSPVLTSFENANVEGLSQNSNTSKHTAKPTSVMPKNNVPSAPPLKSPIGPLTTQNTTTVDPTLSEVTVNAVKDNHKHPSTSSRPVHLQGKSTHDQTRAKEEERSLRIPSTQAPHSPDFPDHQLPSPRLTETVLPEKRRGNGRKLHEREDSLQSIHLPEPLSSQHSRSSTIVDGSAEGLAKLQDTPPLTRISTRDSSTTQPKSPHPLRLMTGENNLKQGAATAPLSLDTAGTIASNSSITNITSPGKRQADKLTPRVSQSRLPGFARTVSSDSTVTGSTIGPHIRFSNVGSDGPTELNGRADGISGAAINKMKSKLLDKEFWMRDENAKDCFHCQEPFSTFRRKHHCRTCGQIFDSRCTILLPGHHFGVGGTIRVCLPCEAMINAHDSDSSDYSADGVSLPSPMNTFRPHTPIAEQQLKQDHYFGDDDTASILSQSLDQMAKTPTIGIPVRRAVGGSNRRSLVMDFDGDHGIPRPSSSRSLRTSHSIGHGHRRNHSKHQHIRNFKAYHEERAPFQRRVGEEQEADSKYVLYRDSVVDPELSQYQSDETSSDDEPSSAFPAQENKISKSAPESDRTPFGGLFAGVKKGRSRLGEKYIPGLLNPVPDGDSASVNSSRAVNIPRPSRRRNLSVASSAKQYLSPRSIRDVHNAGPTQAIGTPSPLSTGQSPLPGRFRMTRSASMKGAGAPAIELNRASLQHVRKLLRQLLKDAEIPKASSWETALIPILLKTTDDVDPDVQHGDDPDIRNYVKFKKIPGGKPGDTSYVSGLVFTKNLALKSMPRSIVRPKILLIGFPLEYARYEQHFMSLEPVIRQEREFLENLVNRIAALGPNLLLAQRNVSGLALQLLEKAKIATAYNVKPSVLDAVSRCCQTKIVHTMDKLAMRPAQVGNCESFDVKTYVFNGRKRTYMFISGCSAELGCTITLRGAEQETLVNIKRITEFMTYVVYNLKLETCLMRDEFALIPSAPEAGLATPAKPSQPPTVSMIGSKLRNVNDRLQMQSVNSSQHDTVDATLTDGSKPNKPGTAPEPTRVDSADSSEIPDDIPVPTFYEDLVEKHQTMILSASPFVKFVQPYLLMRARELERRVAYLKRLRDQDVSSGLPVEEKAKGQKFTLIQPEMVHASLNSASKKVREIIHAVHDSEYDKALHNYETQKRQWETYLSGNRNLFDPYAHQNIVVLYSQVCTSTSIPCFGPELIALGFYNEHVTDTQFVPDCTLGQYVEDLCLGANNVCTANGCERKMFEHHRQYVHGEAQVSVFVQPYGSKMRGMQETILMWSQCKICGNETPVIPMSSGSWRYSFGKYLELSFWSADLHARAGICPHDLHRDHLRYFGYKDFALRFHYDSISILEIIVPRMRITWKVDNDLKFRNDVYNRIEQRINRFMLSVKSRIKTINIEAVMPEIAEACKQEIERLSKRASEDHLSLIKQLQDRYINSRHWETIPINGALRATQEKVAEWDGTFSEFEKNFFPSEKDIRRLATLQLKKIFLDRDVSVTSITSTEDGSATPTSEIAIEEKVQDPEVADGPDSELQPGRPRRMTQLSPEKTQNVLQSVVEEHSGGLTLDTVVENDSNPQADSEKAEEPHTAPAELGAPDVRALDLAMPTPTPSQPFSRQSEIDNGHTLPPSESSEKLSKVPSDSQTHKIEVSNAKGAENKDDRRAHEVIVNNHPPSAIPRPTDTRRSTADGKFTRTPPLLRAQSQPAGTSPNLENNSTTPQKSTDIMGAIQGFGSDSAKALHSQPTPPSEKSKKLGEKKLSDRLGWNHLKTAKLHKGHSLIPRSVHSKKDSRVSNLAKHFEQLSREFEKERIKERRQRAATNRQSRIYPLASSRPIVEVYENVHDAVEEKDHSDESSIIDYGRRNNSESLPESSETVGTADTPTGFAHTIPAQDGEGFHHEDTAAETETTEGEGEPPDTRTTFSETEEEHSDLEKSLLDDIQIPESPEDLAKMTPEDIDLKELPKNERTSLMKMLTTFWAERSSSGWNSLDYPLNSSDHIFADSNIVVREDEPSSLIAFALDSEDYKSKLLSIQQEHHDTANNPENISSDPQNEVMHSLLRSTGTHLKYQFTEGPAKMMCKVFYAEQFDAVRRKCGVSDRIVESLSRCLKWDSKGGKTKSLFLKTLDDRFVLKSLSPIETQAFLKFAPAYFQIVSEAFFHEMPSVIAKMLGFYQVIIKNPNTSTSGGSSGGGGGTGECNWFLLVMENLFYDRVPTRIFDLKGSMRNRKIHSTGATNEVLQDENMVEFIYESPLFAREHSKKLLRGSVHNDTLFLARQNVMDYSLMVAIDEVRKELVVGIIDCIRTYTWDKKLESWIKERGLVGVAGIGGGGMGGGGGRNARPTITSPKEYKKRFREAMGRYVLEAPNCWHQFKGQIERRQLLMNQADVGPAEAADAAAAASVTAEDVSGQTQAQEKAVKIKAPEAEEPAIMVP
ncbi:MAG: hypothetical protein Q9160_008291 [Pyrenula sp. 1 TL-2023]